MGDLSVLAIQKEKVKVYRLRVRDRIIATEIVEKWRTPYEFDDLAFENAVYGKISVRIKDVKRLS